jgi:hypothetical protein
MAKSSQLSAQAITAQTAITYQNVNQVPDIPGWPGTIVWPFAAAIAATLIGNRLRTTERSYPRRSI